jgi:nucleotide-binding universal stress UspA family protein
MYFCLELNTSQTKVKMKNILVPVDFSEHSVLALSYAIELSKSFGENIVLLNTYQIVEKPGEMLNMEKALQKQSEERMKSLLAKTKTHAGNVQIKDIVTHGGAVETITKIAKEEGCDLIVMGSKGASGMREVFIGSIAGGVMEHAEIPVLIIPQRSQRIGFDKVIFAVGQDKINKEDITPLLKLVDACRSELEVVHFGDENENPVTVSENLEFLEDLEDYCMNYAYGKSELDIESKIQTFAKEKDADLICMIRRKRNFWQSLFSSSATLKQAYHSEIPLLILQEK